jgi:hypothetical protein
MIAFSGGVSMSYSEFFTLLLYSLLSTLYPLIRVPPNHGPGFLGYSMMYPSTRSFL